MSNSPPPNPPSPTQTFHVSILPLAVPTPALIDSVAGAAHYSGVNVEPDSPSAKIHHRSSNNGKHVRRASHTEFAPGHQEVIHDLSQLYGCKPSLELFVRRWRRDAVYEDPLSRCEGYNEYAAQWYGLAKLCSKSETLRTRVMSSTRSPNHLVFAQTQEYTFWLFGYKKIIDSIVTVDLDDDDKIVWMTDRWGGKEPPTRFGTHFLRRLSAMVRPWLVWVPK